MKIVFTICSNNYLAQAKTLGNSLLKHNPDYNLAIFLVDKLSKEIDYSLFESFEIIPVDEIGIDGFDEMVERYNITELNTSVKPFIFDYLFSKYKKLDFVIYLDPDILIYQQFLELENYLREWNIILTPHFFTPLYDNHFISEPGILNAGLYNLGFIAVKRSDESQQFLKWWMIKLRDQCYIDFKNGLFVDQLWINLVPLYYEKVLILKHRGYNTAYWNLHERTIKVIDGKYMINDKFPLVFYHFSGYDFKNPKNLSKYQTRYTFDQRSDIVPLFEDYSRMVFENDFDKYALLQCYYIKLKEKQTVTSCPKRSLVSIYKEKIKGILSR